MGKARLGPKSTKIISEPKEVLSKKPSKAPVQQAILPINFQEEKAPETVEKIVYVDKPFETIKEVFVDVIKEIHVPFEVIKIEEKIVEIIKEVPVEVKIIQEKIVEVEKFIDREIHKITAKVPAWMLGLVVCETLTIIGLIIKLI